MGGYGSGRHRSRKPVVEQCRRVAAWEVTPDENCFTVRLRRGGAYRLGACPQCKRCCKHLYETPVGQSWACRKCHGLSYALNTTRHRPAALLVKNPRLLEAGLESAAAFLEYNRLKDWRKAVQTIEAAEEAAQLCLRDDIQERITEADIERVTLLKRIVEMQIDDGRENYVTPDGKIFRVSQSTESFIRLGQLWMALSNLRLTRARLVAQMKENCGEGKITSADIIREEVRAHMEAQG